MLTFSIEDGVTTVAISPDGRFVAAGSLDKSVRVWDTNTGLVVERLDGADGHRDSVYSVAFAPNGRDLVSGSLDKTIKLWELPQRSTLSGAGPNGGRCIKTFEGHKVRRHQPSLPLTLSFSHSSLLPLCSVPLGLPALLRSPPALGRSFRPSACFSRGPLSCSDPSMADLIITGRTSSSVSP